MKTVDIRFPDNTISIMKSLIGQEFKMIKHDPFMFGLDVYGIVGLFIDDNVYKLTNLVEVLDYYGKMEDVAVFRFEATTADKIVTFRVNGEMIDFPIHSKIKEIRIVNENQQLFYNGEQTYDVYTVRGIIFVLQDGREISFEKPIWFSEEIYIRKGYDLIEKFVSTDDFAEGWEGCDGYETKCTREIITIS